MGERLFSPKSLARVAEAVEWEDSIYVYKDGSTNQEQFMKALAILYERWMRNWTLEDLRAVAQDYRSGGFASSFNRLLSTLPNRVLQIKGFLEGLWAGANPGWGKAYWFPPGVLPAPRDPLEVMQSGMESCLAQLRSILFVKEEESNE